MNLLWPGFLLLLLLIPLLIAAYIWVLRRRRHFTVRYSSLALVREAMPWYSRWKRHLPFALFIAALISLVISVGRPVSIVTTPSNQTTIILAMDVSRSMCATDILPSRLESAEAAAVTFIQSQEYNTQIGIVAFAAFAQLVQPPTADRDALQSAIRSLLTGRGTAIGSGILVSLDTIAAIDETVAPITDPFSDEVVEPVPEGIYVPHIIVVLTDGVNRDGIHPLDAAQQAADRGVRVYTIGFGTEMGAEFSNCGQRFQGNEPFRGGGGFGGGGGGFRRGIDEPTLMQIADMTGGEYYVAESGNELQEVFADLPTNLIMKYEMVEISVAFTALGALLAVLAIGLSMLWQPHL